MCVILLSLIVSTKKKKKHFTNPLLFSSFFYPRQKKTLQPFFEGFIILLVLEIYLQNIKESISTMTQESIY
jgi:hypothetical protein